MLGTSPKRARWAFGVVAGVAIPVALAAACADDPAKAPLVNGGNLAGGPGVPDHCATPNEGCSCDDEGAEIDCGRVREQHDDYVTCSMGTRTCTDGEWSACLGDRITVKSTGAGSPGLKTRALGSAQVCPKDAGTEFDPCDPYCNVTPDTPGDFDAGENFSNTDAGLTLIATNEAGIPCTELSIEPTPGTVDADGETVTVTAFGPPPVTTPPGPVTFDVTAGPMGCDTPSPFDVTWTVDQVDRAQITGDNDTNGELTIAVPIAGVMQVTAYALGTSATTTVRVKVNVVEAPTGAGDANEDALGYQVTNFGAWNTPNAGTVMAGVTWLYPYADTYFPLALPAPHVQYWYTNNGGNGTLAALQDRAVKVSLRYPVNTQSNPTLANYSDFNYSVIVRESNAVSRTAGAGIESRNPQVIVPQAAWRYFEQTARGQDADLLIQRQRAGVIENESRRRIHFVDGQLKGAVYYNSYTSPLAGNTGAVLRIAPGATAPTVAVQPTSTSTAGGTRRCTVCHSLNLDGTRLIANGQRPTGTIVMNQSRLYDTSNPATPPYAVPVIQDYNTSVGDTANVPGDRYTFGGPRPGGLLYMTHGGGTGGDPNWRAPPAVSNLFTTTDPNNAVALTGWPSNMQAVTPRFSPSGSRFAFSFWSGSNLAQSPSGTLAAAPGGTRLVVMDFACGTIPCNGTGEGVTNARDVTPGVTDRVAWPSFLPTNDAVIYQRQIRTSRSMANGGVLAGNWSPSHLNTVAGAMAELWMSNVPADSSTAATPTRLLALNGLNAAGTSYLPQDNRPASPFGTLYHQNTMTGASFLITQADNCTNTGTANNVFDHRLNYLPAVSPIQAGGFSWVVFTSRRMYGSVARNDPWDAEPTFSCFSGDPQTKKLWVAAIDGTFTPGTDPSHPAFYLPGQELVAGNSDGYWVSEPCAGLNQACESDDDCCFATGASPTRECRVTSSATVPPTRLCQSISACSMTGAACATTADCCSGLECPMGGGVCVVVPPPPVTIYTPQSVAREYVASCPHGTQAKWRFFEWQATVPTGTNIQFSIQVRASATDPYAPMAPLLLSTATPASGTGPGTWYRGPSTVDQALANAVPPLASGDYLLVTMSFNPTMMESPTLHQWRQIFDCVPAE